MKCVEFNRIWQNTAICTKNKQELHSCIIMFTGELSGGLVAVKVVKKEHADDALKEVETMAAFNHPNILRMVGIAKHEGKCESLQM